jgi:hypothetical protein
MLPDSTASNCLSEGKRTTVAMEVAGFSGIQLLNALSAAARTSAGANLLPRTKALVGELVEASEVFGDWRELPNPAAGQSITEHFPERKSPPESYVEAAKSSLSSGKQAAKDDLSGVSPGARSLRDAFRLLINAWHGTPRLLWWILRPASTLTAFAACLWQLNSAPFPALAIAAGLLVLVVRPVKRQWAAVLLALVCFVVSPVASIAVLTRALTGLVALHLNGRSVSAGIDILQGSRRQVIGPLDSSVNTDLDEVWATLDKNFEAMPDLAEDYISEVLIAAWCTADARTEFTSAWAVGRGVLSGKWRGTRRPSMSAAITRLLARESLLGWSFSAIALGLGGFTNYAIFAASPQQPAGALSKWASILASAILTEEWSRTLLARRRRRWGRLLLLSAAQLTLTLTAGINPLLALVAGSTVGLGIGYGRRKSMQVRFTKPSSVPRLPPSLWFCVGHDEWKTARSAARVRPEIARELWAQMAANPHTDRHIAALSRGMLAEVALQNGSWEEAVLLVEQALKDSDERSLAGYHVRLIAAKTKSTTGATEEAYSLLHDLACTFRRRLLRDPTAMTLFARSAAANGHADAAMEWLSRVRPGRNGAGLGLMLESQTVVATELGKQDPARAADALVGALQFFDDEDVLEAIDADDAARLDLLVGRACLALGAVLRRIGAAGEAEVNLRRAARTLPTSEAANRATAQVLLGATLAERDKAHDALILVEDGLTTLESARGQLSRSSQRARLVIELDETYTVALDSLNRLQSSSAHAGQVGGVLLESLRRDAQADLLRSGDLKLSPTAQSTQMRINEIEALPKSEVPEAELESLRKDLAAEISEIYASTYAPRPVEWTDLVERAAGCHVLMFRLSARMGGLYGHVLWIAPNGTPYLAPITITDEHHLTTFGLLGRGARHEVMRSIQTEPEQLLWRRLAELLLPKPLRDALLCATTQQPTRLLIVPDGPLAAFPWAALCLSDHRRLVEVAVIQILPTLALMTSTPPQQSYGDAIMLHAGSETFLDVRRLLGAFADVHEASNRKAIERLVAEGRLSGAYFSSHGDGVGLAQSIELAGGGEISAASALSLAWPDWILFASCIVGELDIRAGLEATGLATSSLLGGAHTVIAGVIEVEARMADRIGVSTAARLIDCRHPAVALREAQLSVLAKRRLASPHRWAGYVCISRLRLDEAAVA